MTFGRMGPLDFSMDTYVPSAKRDFGEKRVLAAPAPVLATEPNAGRAGNLYYILLTAGDQFKLKVYGVFFGTASP